MTIHELIPMSPDAFKAELKARGWTPELLSIRWGMTKRRVQQIIADESRPAYYDDAIRGLPIVIGGDHE